MEKYKRLTIETKDGKYELDCGLCPNKHYELCFESDCNNVVLKQLIDLENKIEKGELIFVENAKPEPPKEENDDYEVDPWLIIEKEFKKFLEEVKRGKNRD